MIHFYVGIENCNNLMNEGAKGLSRTDIGDQVDINKTVNFTVGAVGRGRDLLLSEKELLGVSLDIICSASDKFFNIGKIVSDTPGIFEDGKKENQKKFYDRFVKIPKNLRSRIIK